MRLRRDRAQLRRNIFRPEPARSGHEIRAITSPCRLERLQNLQANRVMKTSQEVFSPSNLDEDLVIGKTQNTLNYFEIPRSSGT